VRRDAVGQKEHGSHADALGAGELVVRTVADEQALFGLDFQVLAGEPPSQDYVREVRSLLAGRQRADAVTAMNVKSTFSRPVDGATLFGRRFTLRGAAWAGENRVRRVEVSIDGCRSWQPAHLESESKPYAWVCWSHEWTIARPGSYELVVTATDDHGRQQPAERPSNRVDDYEWNRRQLIQVTVK